MNKDGKKGQNRVLWSHNFLKIDLFSPLVLWELQNVYFLGYNGLRVAATTPCNHTLWIEPCLSLSPWKGEWRFFMASTQENWNFWKRVRVSLYRVQNGGKRLFTFDKSKRLGFLRLLGFWKGLNSFTLFNVFTHFSNNSPHEWN